MLLTVVAIECETEQSNPTTRVLSGKGMASTKLQSVKDPTVHHGHKRFGLHGPMKGGVGIQCPPYAIHVVAHIGFYTYIYIDI